MLSNKVLGPDLNCLLKNVYFVLDVRPLIVFIVINMTVNNFEYFLRNLHITHITYNNRIFYT